MKSRINKQKRGRIRYVVIAIIALLVCFLVCLYPSQKSSPLIQVYELGLFNREKKKGEKKKGISTFIDVGVMYGDMSPTRILTGPLTKKNYAGNQSYFMF